MRLQAYNGAINGIDTVLLPPGISLPVPSPAAPTLQAEAVPLIAEVVPAAAPVAEPFGP